MTTVSSMNSAALLILQQTNSISATQQQKSVTDDLVAVANGIGGKIGATKQPSQTQSRISESMFNLNNVNVNKLKLDLIERAGKALGVDQNDYASKDEFVSAMQGALSKLKAQDDGQQAIAVIEKGLGLDKLGVTLEDVINSAKNPDREDTLDKALAKQAGKEKEHQSEALLTVQPNEIGLYGIANV
ncbi:hypothetical protein [Rhizobium sp. PP-CC-3G-465]|uniref:hypothetical protein n=1 Tax=Rhizobium sp. PP-CC-3G-465 TaxID=2135648 RepID=UPI001052C9DD|nr:hypothetical protein C8J33_12234 [Rhizobium sp. PP-CC-3G-465]